PRSFPQSLGKSPFLVVTISEVDRARNAEAASACGTLQGAPVMRPRPRWLGRGARSHGRGTSYPTFGQVVLIQLAAAVGWLWPLPGFGQSAGAVMLRIGMVMIRSGSQTGNG